MQTITLNNGVQMPVLGFGTFQAEDGGYKNTSMYSMFGFRLTPTA